MSEQTKRDAKLVRFLNDAYTTERRLEVALQVQIEGTTRGDYLERLEQHLKETRSHAKAVERRIKQLGGAAVLVRGPDALNRGAEAAQGAMQRASVAVRKPLDAVLGTGSQERMLKNARTGFVDEAREIATYRVIEAVATAVGDTETAKLARKILREEQRMSDFLADLIPELALDTAADEIPVAEIEGPAAPARSRKPSRSSSNGTKSSGSRKSSSSSRSSGAKTRKAKPRAGARKSSSSSSSSSGSSRKRSSSSSS
jgi:ferritin-like metal-binding protein YciE